MAGEMNELANTAIGKAISSGNLIEIKKLFKSKDAPFYKDKKGNTYLHYSCTVYKPYIVNIIIATGLQVNTQNKYGNTALHVSALQNECWHVADLLAAGINPNIKNWEGKRACDLQHKNKYWMTIYQKLTPGIFEAVSSHDVDRIKQLLSYWTRADCVRNGQTLRQFAAQLKYHDIVRMLDEHKPTLDLVYGVLELNYDKVYDSISKTRCNINFLNKAGIKQHILQHAIDLKDEFLVNLLCDSGADVNILVTLNSYYKGPLYLEAINSSISDAMKWKILKSSINVTLRDERGRNALIYALDKNNGTVPLTVIEFLIKKGANIADRDETGCNVRDVARFCRRKDVVDFIDKVREDLGVAHESPLESDDNADVNNEIELNVPDDTGSTDDDNNEYYIKLLRQSNIEKLLKLVEDSYDSLLIDHNYRDTYIYACGNETDEVVQFVKWLPAFQAVFKKFHKLIKNGGSLEEIQTLYDLSDSKPLLLNCKDKGGRSSGTLSVLYNRLDVLDYILNKPDMNINSQDNSQRTAYHYACCHVNQGRELREMLLKHNINTKLVDNMGRTGAMYLREDHFGWIKKTQKKLYGMELELYCVDAYEELRSTITSKTKGLEDFCFHLKTICIPVGAFSVLLSPVVLDYRDLLFLAVDYNKPEIAIRLVELGTDLSRKEKYMVRSLTQSTDKNTHQDSTQDERLEKWLTPDERADYLNLNDLSKKLKHKKSLQQKSQISVYTSSNYSEMLQKLSRWLNVRETKVLNSKEDCEIDSLLEIIR